MSPILKRINSSCSLTEKMLISYMRVIFNGKTDILSDIKSFNLEAYNKAIKDGEKPNERLLKTSKRAKILMKLLEKNTIDNSSIKKTDGWTTNFLNFACKQIEEESAHTKQSFSSRFKIYFPELYDIIHKLQPDSRGEV